MELFDLAFSDLFVAVEPASSWIKATPDAREMEGVPEQFHDELGELRQALLEQSKGNAFSLWWGQEPRERLRVKPMTTARVDPLFVCRRFTGRPRPLKELGMAPTLVDRLLEKPVRNGLILFMGAMGAGKTTAASAYTVDYVSKHGGVAVTVEAPMEMDIEGRHGRGVVYQTEVESDEELGPALRGMLRSAANLLFPGEVKTDGAAREVLMLSTSGHPVVTTFHAPDLPTGLMRYARATGDQYDALADALTAVFHLSLQNAGNAAPSEASRTLPGRPIQPERLLKVAPLLVISETRERVRSAIRSGNFHQLESEIDRQKRMLLGGRLA